MVDEVGDVGSAAAHRRQLYARSARELIPGHRNRRSLLGVFLDVVVMTAVTLGMSPPVVEAGCDLQMVA